MSASRTSKRALVAAATLVGLSAGVMAAAHAAPFRDRAYEAGHTQQIPGDPAPAWPKVLDTCTTDCTIPVVATTITVPVKDAVDGNVSVPALGFGVNGGTPGLAGSAGSILKVPQGTKVTINVDDSAVPGGVELSFPSIAVVDHVVGSDTYVVHADKVGTSVFQPGTNADAPRQIAMGLVGVLIVTPKDGTGECANCAYDTADTYAEEAVVATTDLDLAFAQAYPAHYDMSYFGQARDAEGNNRRVYHVINGKSFPDTDVIDTRPGHKLLLRYVNAGNHDSSLGALGLRQDILARNTSQFTPAQSVVAPVIGPGETADVRVTIPADAVAGQKYSLQDQGNRMGHGDAGFGGALTFINVWGGAVDTSVAIDSFDATTGDLAASVTLDSQATLVGYQVLVNDGTAPATDTDWTNAEVAQTTTPFTINVPGVLHGQTVWLRVHDSNGTWSAAASIAVPFDAPTVTITNDPNATDGIVQATATVDAALTVTSWEIQVVAGGGAAVDGNWTTVPGTALTLDTTVTGSSGDEVWVRVTDSHGATAATSKVLLP